MSGVTPSVPEFQAEALFCVHNILQQVSLSELISIFREFELENYLLPLLGVSSDVRLSADALNILFFVFDCLYKNDFGE